MPLDSSSDQIISPFHQARRVPIIPLEIPQTTLVLLRDRLNTCVNESLRSVYAGTTARWVLCRARTTVEIRSNQPCRLSQIAYSQGRLGSQHDGRYIESCCSDQCCTDERSHLQLHRSLWESQKQALLARSNGIVSGEERTEFNLLLSKLAAVDAALAEGPKLEKRNSVQSGEINIKAFIHEASIFSIPGPISRPMPRPDGGWPL